MRSIARFFAFITVFAWLSISNALATVTTTVTLYDTPYNDLSGGGGEFTAVSPFNFIQFYDDKATSGTGNKHGFETFCLEKSESVSYGVTYFADINIGAKAGGGTGGGLSPIVNGMDRLSKGTAWLYSQFAAGTLAGYNYSTTHLSQSGSRRDSSRLLQNAIWALEGEISWSYSNPFLQSVVTKFGSIAAAAADAAVLSNGAVEYNVVALNLYKIKPDGTRVRVQDQLAVIPESATVVAGALLLVPFAAGVIRIVRNSGRSKLEK